MSQILFEQTDSRAILTLNRPEKLNALTSAMKADLIRLLEGLRADERLRVIVFTGSGDKAFCAGTDIRELSELSDQQGIEVSESGQKLSREFENFPVPVIAAVNGLAAGGGFELLLGCHLRIASTEATFSLPETWLGLMPAYGATQRLVREIGLGNAVEWMLTRRTISAEEAFDFGLLNRIVPPGRVLAEALSLAHEIEQLSPLSIRACLKAVTQGIELPLAEGLALETELFASLFATEDAREGTRAFLEKRKPVFKGK
jgi:enoyl-CoA hydratase